MGWFEDNAPNDVSTPNYVSVGGEDNPDPFQHYPDEDGPGGIPPVGTPGSGSLPPGNMGTPAPGPISYPGFEGYGLHDVGKGGDADTWINEGDVLKQLRDDAAKKGVPFDISDADGVFRNLSYDQNTKSLQQLIDEQKAIYTRRAASNAPATTAGAGSGAGTGGSGGGSGAGGGNPAGAFVAGSGIPGQPGFGAGGVYYPSAYHSNANAPTPPALMAPYVAPTWTGGDFIEPTMAQVEASPGYQTRLDAGRLARERSAAASGTVLNGGTQRALERFGQEYGTGEYQTFRANAFQDYLTKYGQFVDKGNADFGARTENIAEAQTDYGNRTNAFNSENQRTLGDFLTNTAAQRGASNDYWDRLIALYNGGRATAGGSYQAPA